MPSEVWLLYNSVNPQRVQLIVITFYLYIKNLCKVSSSGLKLIVFIGIASALGTDELSSLYILIHN